MNKPVLVIMAAGMGSRYGGLKQVDPVGPAGEVILHYSIYDAWRAGFRKVVLLIRKEHEEDFREVVADKARRLEGMEVVFAFQSLEDIPEPFTVPESRRKPWGTGHAVLCCREAIGDAPFCVINADDYYGPGAMQSAWDFLKNARDDDRMRFMMVAYLLRNTTSANGHVSRGICHVNAQGHLTAVREVTHIVESCDGPLYTEDGETYRRLDGDTLVSMNLWGFTPSMLGALQAQFPDFLAREVPLNPEKAEFFLPSVVSRCIDEGKATVTVLSSPDTWFGMTYQQDRDVVVRSLKAKTEAGLYPSPLFP